MNIFEKKSINASFQHAISSIVYRFIIIVYGGLILVSHNNHLPIVYYAVFLSVYFFFCLIILEDKYKYIRLLLDLFCIILILYGKTPLDNVCFVYALFPLISSIVHTGSHINYWPILFLTWITFLIIDKQFAPMHFMVSFLIWLAGTRSWYNHQTNRILSTITTHIDNYFADNDGSKRPHKIYQKIIDEINSYLKVEYLKNIYSYILEDDDTLWLVNSSKFMWNRKMILPSTFIKALQKEYYQYDEENHMLYFYVGQSGVRYVYLCEIDAQYHKRMSFVFNRGFVVNYILIVTFGKISTILASEYRIAETRRKAFEETKSHIGYVTRALKVMHFIRNKLSPIKTVITFYSQQDSMDVEKKKKMEERVKKEVRQANNDLAEILQTANFLLDKQNNPYGGADIENKKVEWIFVVLSEIVEFHLGGIVNVSTDITESKLKKEVRISMTQMKLLFTDIVSNIEKYKTSEYNIEMGLEEEFLVVTFMNDIEPKQESDCRTLMRDINNSNNEGIISRKSHGVYNIKSAASVMAVLLKADIITKNNNKYYILTTKFRLYECDKDSSN